MRQLYFPYSENKLFPKQENWSAEDSTVMPKSVYCKGVAINCTEAAPEISFSTAT